MSVLSNPGRLAMLSVLCDGEPRGASELATIAGCTPSAGSKHARLMVEAGVLLRGRGQLYRLVPGFQTAPGKRELDFGHCLLRLDYQAGN
jgi:hypothetical protein